MSLTNVETGLKIIVYIFTIVWTAFKILNELNNEKLSEIKNKMSEISKRRYMWKRISEIYQEHLT